MLACTRALRTQPHKHTRIGAVGFCYGGWAAVRLGSSIHNNNPDSDPITPSNQQLINCLSIAHPSWLTKSEISSISVPTQILAPEFDPVFTAELKEYSNRVIPGLGVGYDYQYFPGLKHAFATRGDVSVEGERRGMERAMGAVVYWMREGLRG